MSGIRVYHGSVSQRTMLQMCGIPKATFYAQFFPHLICVDSLTGKGGRPTPYYTPVQVLAVCLARDVQRRIGPATAVALLKRLAPIDELDLVTAIEAGRDHIGIVMGADAAVTPLMPMDAIRRKGEEKAAELRRKGSLIAAVVPPIMIVQPIDVGAGWRKTKLEIDTFAAREEEYRSAMTPVEQLRDKVEHNA